MQGRHGTSAVKHGSACGLGIDEALGSRPEAFERCGVWRSVMVMASWHGLAWVFDGLGCCDGEGLSFTMEFDLQRQRVW